MAQAIVTTDPAVWAGVPGGATMAIQEDGSPLPARATLNFAEGITAVDNPTVGRTDVTVPGVSVLSVNGRTGAIVVADLDEEGQVPASQLGNVGASAASAVDLTKFHAGGGEVVATRAGVCANAAFISGQSSNVQSAHVMIRGATTIRLFYLNGHHELDNTNSLTVTAQISTGAAGAGPFNKVYFGGKRSVVLDAGAGVLSDPVGVDLAAGSTFYVHTYQDAGVSGVRVQNHYGFQTGEFGNATVADQTGTQLSSGTTGGLIPTYIVAGKTISVRKAMIGVYGDSIADGRHDNYQMGFIARAVSGTYGYVNAALGSDAMHLFVQTVNSIKRRARQDGITAAICNSGINDISDSRTLPQMRADLQTMVGIIRRTGAVSVTWCTTLPKTTSTDAWVTATNQTPGPFEASRLAWNTDLRANFASYGIDFLFDAADVVEVNNSDVLTRNGGIFRPAYITNPVSGAGVDGVHPGVDGHAALATALAAFIVAHPTARGI